MCIQLTWVYGSVCVDAGSGRVYSKRFRLTPASSYTLTLSPPSTPSLEEQMRGLRVFGGGAMELPGITRTGLEASQTTVLLAVRQIMVIHAQTDFVENH